MQTEQTEWAELRMQKDLRLRQVPASDSSCNIPEDEPAVAEEHVSGGKLPSTLRFTAHTLW